MLQRFLAKVTFSSFSMYLSKTKKLQLAINFANFWIIIVRKTI